jgi:transposase
VRTPYPSDLSDAEWALLAPLLPPPKPTGRPRKWPDRLVADAGFYVLRSGCAWRMLPREFPPWPTVFSRFRRWRLDGTLRRAHDVLRALVRRQAGRTPEPSAAVIDSQSAKTAGVGGPARGYDGGKRVKGRKRHILVDVMGLLLAVCVHGAGTQGSPSATARARGCSQRRFRLTRCPCFGRSGPTRATPGRWRRGCETRVGGASMPAKRGARRRHLRLLGLPRGRGRRGARRPARAILPAPPPRW